MSRKALIVVGAAGLLALATSCGSSSGGSAGTSPSTSIGPPTSTSTGGSAATPAPGTPAPGTPVPVTTPAPATSTGPAAAPGPAATPAPAPATVPGQTVNPNGPEIVEPGDIPDNQVFVTFQSADGTYSIDVPEGWARTDQGTAATFTDKYNSVQVDSHPATSAPTVESVTATGLDDVKSDPTFTLIDVAPATRAGGDCIRATYEIGSPPNAVTGKSALLAVERFVCFHNGTEVVLTLSGAKGADNVDPWKIVSDSLTWS